MNIIETKTTACPYCGETIEMQVDCSLVEQNYIEDCSVCCRPIVVKITILDNENINMDILTENDC